MTIKIYGYGWVGKAMKTLFPDALIHDPAQGFISEQVADVAFVCVPTPLVDGKLDCSIVKEVVKNAKENLIIIRSTVMPGTCDKLTFNGAVWDQVLNKKTGLVTNKKNIVFQPEYLGETVNHPMTDQKARQFVILGGSPENVQKVIELYQTIYNANTTFRQMTAYEAEVVKLTENRAIAFKVAQCQELYDVCQKAGVDYNNIREAVYSDDPRFNLWWTFVHPDKRGFNSKCIPKDVYGWAAWAESVGYKPELTIKLLETNDALIRSNTLI